MTDDIRAKIDEINRTKMEDAEIYLEKKAVWLRLPDNCSKCSNCGATIKTVHEKLNCHSCGKPMREMEEGDAEEYHV